MTAYASPPTDPTNVVGRRIAAYLIDALIALVIVMAVTVPAFTATAQKVGTRGRSNFCDPYNDRDDLCLPLGDSAYILRKGDFGGVLGAFYGTGAAWLVLNSVVLQGLTGGTVGKLLLGLRVVRHDGRRAGVGWSALRTLLLPIDSLCLGAIGLVATFTSRGHRRLGDMVASTLVVPKQYEGHPVNVAGLTTVAVGSGGGAPGPWGTPLPGPPATVAGNGNGPTWDPARNAYIQYDRTRSSWVQWNDTSKEWRPIDQ